MNGKSPPHPATSLRKIWFLLTHPTYTLPIVVAPVLLGVALAIRDHVFALWPGLPGFVVSWFYISVA